MKFGVQKHDYIESTETCHQRNHWRPDDSLIQKGERSILSHVAFALSGLLDGYMLLHWGYKSKNSAGHHSEMNWNAFSYWCNRVIFPAIAARRKTQSFLDSASYLTYIDEEHTMEQKPKTRLDWSMGRTVRRLVSDLEIQENEISVIWSRHNNLAIADLQDSKKW